MIGLAWNVFSAFLLTQAARLARAQAPARPGAPTPGTAAGRPQPQTTLVSSDQFLEASKRAQRPGYSVQGGPSVFGGSIDQPLPGAPGYLRFYELTINATGGGNATTNSVAGNTAGSIAADFGLNNAGITSAAARSALGTSPLAAVQFINVQDAHGTTVFSGPGWEMLYALPLISGQVGILAASDLMVWPSLSTAGVATGTATTRTGNFFIHAQIPFEILPGYGLLGIGDATLQPRLHMQFAAQGSLWTTAPSTVPVLTTTVDEAYHEDRGMLPPGLGTTLQAIAVTASPTIGSGASNRVQIARLGGRLVGVMLIARDANGMRNDNVWPAFGSNQRIRLIVDGVTLLDEQIEERFDKMFLTTAGELGSVNGPSYGSVASGRMFPAGMIFYTWKDFEAQANLGKLDNGVGWIPTNPGTLLELECTPWGTFSNGPAQLTAVLLMVVPGRGTTSQPYSNAA